MMDHLVPLHNAFHELTTSRMMNDFGEGPIPLSEVHAYCMLFGIDDLDERADFVRAIRAMDSVYLAERQKERERQKDDADKKAEADEKAGGKPKRQR